MTPANSAPNALYGHSSEFDAIAGKLYIIGGYNGTWYQNAIWTFTVKTGMEVVYISSIRHFIRHRIYLFVNTATWALVQPANSGISRRSGHSSVNDNSGHIYIIAGNEGTTVQQTVLSDIWKMTTSTSKST